MKLFYPRPLYPEEEGTKNCDGYYDLPCLLLIREDESNGNVPFFLSLFSTVISTESRVISLGEGSIR